MKIIKMIPVILSFMIIINFASGSDLEDWYSLNFIIDSIFYPNADKNKPEISRNISFTVNIYQNQCSNNQIKEIKYFEDQVGYGRTRINLKNLGLTFREFDAISYSLRVNRTVTYLVLDGNFIGDAGAKMLSDLLSENNTIKTVELLNCSIGDAGKVLLKNTIKDKTNRINLIDLDKRSSWEENVNIYLNSCYNNNLPVYKSFLNYFRVSRDIIRIPYRLEDNLTIPYDLIFFSSSYLEDIDSNVINNDLNYDSIVLGDLIRNSRLIESVYISEADFTNFDASYFFDSFAFSTNLKSLVINSSTFDDKNSRALFNKVNKSYIDSFQVTGCSNFSDDQMGMLIKTVAGNKNINRLYFRDDTGFSRKAFSQLVQALCYSNNTIRHLSITGRTVDNDPNLAYFNRKFPEYHLN